MLHSQELSSNPYPDQINPIPRIYTYLFKIHSHIALPKGLFPAGIAVKMLKSLIASFILTT